MSNIAVLWDIQNIIPSKSNASLFVEGLIAYCESLGQRSYSLAVGDWINKTDAVLASMLSENGFELLLIPQIDENGKKTKDSVDFIIITKATEMIFQYPHLDTYIIIGGDVDYRPLLLLLKKHGKKVVIIYNGDNVSERLLEFADDHKDYRELIPEESDQIDISADSNEKKDEINKEEAFNLLIEAINQMISAKKTPTPGSVKVRMKMINGNFNESIIGIKNWIDFIYEAANKNIITYQQTNNDIVLSLKQNSDDIKNIFDEFIRIMKLINKKNEWIKFTDISKKLIDEKITIKKYGYTKFKKLALEAESRGLIKIKNEGLQWSAKSI